MKGFRKFLALVMVLSCCVALAASPAAAYVAESEDVSITADADVIQPRSKNIEYVSGTTQRVYIDHLVKKYTYTSGATTRDPMSGFISVRFTGDDGSVRNYSYVVPRTLGGEIECNLTQGWYTITTTGGTPGLEAKIYLNF